MKKIFAFILTIAVLFSLAALAVDARTATETARSLAPEGSVYLYTEKDGKNYEIHFLIGATNEEFEISVPLDESMPVKIETENDFALGSTANTVTEERIREVVLSEYPDAQIDSFFAVKEDGLFEIHVYFACYDHFGRLKLNAETGNVIERKILMKTPLAGWQAELDDDYYKDVQKSENALSGAADDWAWSASPNESAQPPKEDGKKNDNNASDKVSFISVSQAKSAVTSRHPGAKITDIELDFEDGKYVYEGEAYLNGREYDFEVDATTGSLIRWKIDD